MPDAVQMHAQAERTKSTGQPAAVVGSHITVSNNAAVFQMPMLHLVHHEDQIRQGGWHISGV